VIPVSTLHVSPDLAQPPAPTPAVPPQLSVAAALPAPAAPPEEVAVPVPVYLGFVVTTPPVAPPAKPVRPLQTTAAKPAPKPVAIPAPLPSGPAGPPHRRPPDRSRGEEQDLDSKVQRDLEAGHWEQALKELDDWSARFPQSKLTPQRLYQYMQAHSALAHPDRVLEFGAALMSPGQAGLDERQTAAVLYLTTVNAAALPKPSKEQRALGAAAAQSLLESLPRYFEESRRPGTMSSEQWTASRKQLETAARDALKKLLPRPAA
jgi:hypothetical protein